MENGFNFKELLSAYFNLDEVFDYVSWQALVFILLGFILLWVGKKVNDMVTSYDLDHQLTQEDNKALSVSFMGYIIGLGIIIVGVIAEPSVVVEGEEGISQLSQLGKDVLSTVIWALVGIVLLNLSRVINDKFILSKFNNKKELIEDKNVGTGAVLFGSYVGSAFIIKALISGEDTSSLPETIINTVVFFLLGQVGFILFGIIYQKITKFDLHAEIEKDNVAAGVGFGMTLVAVGIILAHAVATADSIFAFAAWFINGVVLLVLTRYLIDKLILPGSLLDDEVQKDQNWGASLIEGGAAIVVAFLINSAFL